MKMQGFINAKKIFFQARKNIPAYINFLDSNNFNISKNIKLYSEWLQIPLTSKKSYILEYPLNKLIDKNIIPPITYASSGSTGKPTFWFGNDNQEALSLLSHKNLFKKMYGIKKNETTLVIICFAMDLWMAGHHTLVACRGLSRLGYKLTTATPGYSIERVISVLTTIGEYYKNIVFAGHPSFVMDILSEIEKLQLLDKRKQYKVLVTGSKISEEWRDDLLSILRQKDDIRTICNIYGSTDAGKMAYETPLTISLKKKLPTLELMELFDCVDDSPGIYQFHAESIFFESINNQLVITTDTPIPLVRYNIKDNGSVFTVKQLLKKSNSKIVNNIINKFPEWDLPLVAVTGRSNVSVTFYSLLIYPEHISAGVQSSECKKYLSGKFFAYTQLKNRSKNEEFILILELSKELKSSDLSSEERLRVSKTIFENLKKLNIEYNKLSEMIKYKAYPKIIFKKFGDKNFYPKQVNGVYLDSKGKPKLINVK